MVGGAWLGVVGTEWLGMFRPRVVRDGEGWLGWSCSPGLDIDIIGWIKN